MRIRLLAVGQRLPDWMNAGFAEYARRLPHECRLEMQEIPPGDRSGRTEPDRARRKEGERILKALGNDRLIALDERGKSPDTLKLADWLGDWLMDGRDLTLAIGGADGLDAEVLNRAERRWSLSPLTLPHGLVRVVVAEQLYRAWSVRSGHPYHRG